MKQLMLLSLLFTTGLNVTAAQMRQLHCTAVLTVDIKSNGLGGLQIRRELPIVQLTKKGSQVLADAGSVLSIQDVLGFSIVNIKASSFLYENKKMAGLTLSISDENNEYVKASGSGIIVLNKKADDSGAMQITAPLKEALSATFLRSDLELPGNGFAEVNVTSIAAYCNLR